LTVGFAGRSFAGFEKVEAATAQKFRVGSIQSLNAVPLTRGAISQYNRRDNRKLGRFKKICGHQDSLGERIAR
jgi:hypothetical protein